MEGLSWAAATGHFANVGEFDTGRQVDMQTPHRMAPRPTICPWTLRHMDCQP